MHGRDGEKKNETRKQRTSAMVVRIKEVTDIVRH